MEYKMMVIFSLIYLMVFVCAELLYHLLHVKAEYTRKFVHVFIGIINMFLPFGFSSHWPVLVLLIAFVIILSLSMKYDFLKSINAVNRKTRGSLVFPAAIYLCFLLYFYSEHKIVFYLPLLILSFADPFAAIVGKNIKSIKYKSGQDMKSIAGSIAFFCVAFLVSIILFLMIDETSLKTSLILSVVISAATTITEAWSTKGYDNISIPLVVLMILYLFY